MKKEEIINTKSGFKGIDFKDKNANAFCPICGELEIKDGKIVHPELDKHYADILSNPLVTVYINK